MFFDEKHVITGAARVLWDGTKGETAPNGSTKWTMKVAMLATDPALAEINQIVQNELMQGEFKGVLPPNGQLPVVDIAPGQYDNMLVGHITFNTATYRGVPDVYDVNGTKLDPIQYQAMLYPGATVQLIVHAYTYNNVSKGVALGLDGIKIIDATTPKLPVGESIDSAAAFATAPAAAVPGAAPAAAVPGAAPAAVDPAYDFLTINGQQYSVAQLTASGWTPEQINAAR